MSERKLVKPSKGDEGTLCEPSTRNNSHSAPRPFGPRELRRQPRQARALATVEVILEASTRVFVRRSYAEATTNEVAEVAGVSIGSLYQYFPDKTALLTALHERHVASVTSRLMAVLLSPHITSQGLGPTLAAVVRSCIQLHHDNPRLQRLLHQEYPQLAYPRAESSAKMRLHRAVAAWLQAQDNEMADDRASLMSSTLLTMSEGLVHNTVLSPSPGLPLPVLEANITNALWGYLNAQGLRGP